MGLNILVVDDAGFVRDTIKRTIRQYATGVTIFEAVNGKRAVAAMKANKIDLILSDWEMPEMSGEEFLQWVRAHPTYCETPFIMVTSRGDRSHIMLAVNAGVSDYLTKPFTPEEFKHKLAKQFKRLGFSPKQAPSPGGIAAASIDVLTGGGGRKAKPSNAEPQVVAATGFGKPQIKSQAKPVARKANSFDGKANLRFANTMCEIVVQDLSLQAVSGTMERVENMPRVFDQAVVDLESLSGEVIGRLNAYVHAVQAGELRPNTNKVKIALRFVDNDPNKFEALSKVIS